jgi:hypothetical protein
MTLSVFEERMQLQPQLVVAEIDTVMRFLNELIALRCMRGFRLWPKGLAILRMKEIEGRDRDPERLHDLHTENGLRVREFCETLVFWQAEHRTY